MNTKELIEAAVNVKRQRGRFLGNSCVYLADHILATVREDDDEVATYEWAKNTLPLPSRMMYGRQYSGGKWIPEIISQLTHGTSYCQLEIGSTRGQLRKLLEALGVSYETK